MRTVPRSWLAIVVALTGAAPLGAQSRWDDIPWSPAAPVIDEGGLILHDNGSSLFAFSAVAQQWMALAPSGSTVLGSGDWVALVAVSGGYTGYGARRASSSFIAAGGALLGAWVGDDVALVITQSGGAKTAHAYSAVTGSFVSTPYVQVGPTVASDVAVSRFVAVLRSGSSYKGFAARKGVWSTLATPTAPASPVADANVGLGTTSIIGAGPAAAAFSGVLGTWATSPLLHASNATLLTPNLAFVHADAGASWRACGYSAYNGAWVTSPVLRAPVAHAIHVTDNVLLIQGGPPPEPGLEALGARPGLAWASHGPSVALSVPVAPDFAFATTPSGGGDTKLSFSGVCDGTWKPQSFVSFLSTSLNHAHVATGVDGLMIRGYSPRTNSFTATIPSFFVPTLSDATVDLTRANGVHLAYSARWGTWVEGPPWTGSDVVATGGSFVARQHADGSIDIFDERCNEWPPAFAPGAPSAMHAGRNVLLAQLQSGGLAVHGYSVQRADWTDAGGAAGAPLLGPVVEDDVGWYVDSAGALRAFGAPGDLHFWYQWPNDTEYQTAGVAAPASVPPSPLGFSLHGLPGESAALLFALAPLCPGIPVGAIAGLLWLDPGTLQVLASLGGVGPSGVLAFTGTLGSLGAPQRFTLWMQGFFVTPGAKRLGTRSDPLLVF
ncbi:MAG TPA: hypothetical protein VFD43_12575 [Planctomycetota bacterium]|nr:hypothetical protein [Planctomycetota bacterium]